jgi:hypothetical protein
MPSVRDNSSPDHELPRLLRTAPVVGRAVPAEAVSTPRRGMLLGFAVLAGLSWAGTLALLLWGDLAVFGPPFAPTRLLFYACVLLAGGLTFVPLQWLLRLPGLAFKGVLGCGLLCYILAFVPPPSGPAFWLPDTPVYLLLALATLAFVSAVTLPVIFTIGRLVFRQRARQYDLRRARRQANGAGALAALCVLLAGLRVLTPLSAALLIGILVVLELLFLAMTPAEAT